MKGTLQVMCLSLALYATTNLAAAEIASQSYMFIYDGKSYELVLDNLSWTQAAAAAVQKGGILAEINSQEEQDSVYYQVKNNAGIQTSNTQAPDGGGAAYVWLGGNDIALEGTWIWDGGNTSNGSQFWQGLSAANGGYSVGGSYTNWGNEPDNFGYGQDALGLALTNWPLGTASQWNDISAYNNLYYLIEYPNIVPVEMSCLSARVFAETVTLTWTTETETNNYGWSIERQTENDAWTQVGFVQGSGNATRERTYTYTDHTGNLHGLVAYRLKQLDYNSTFEYSATVRVELRPSSGVKSGEALPLVELQQTYPQPATEQIHIPFSMAGDHVVSLRLYTTMGQLVDSIREGTPFHTGVHTVSIPTSQLQAGVYLLVLKSGMMMQTQKVTVTR